MSQDILKESTQRWRRLVCIDGELEGGSLLGGAGLAVQEHWQGYLQVDAHKVHSAAGCGRDIWKALERYTSSVMMPACCSVVLETMTAC